jgi:hypothetical protein
MLILKMGETRDEEPHAARQLFSFCQDRRWVPENYARKIKTPNFQPNEVVPYTPQQVAQM